MAKYTKEEMCLLWLDSFVGLEYKHKKSVYQTFVNKANIVEALHAVKEYLVSEIGEKEFNTLSSSANKTYLEYLIAELDRKGVVAITCISTNYPKALENLELAPLVLYAKGDLSLLNSDCFAIVGSRRSLPLSIGLAENFAKALGQNFTLVTGIAEGVDSAVLKSALSNGKKVISVIAGGIDNVYPATNKSLIEKVFKQGLVISEYPPKTIPKPYFFPIRNRIIAGLSKGVLVVSGAKKSGTLYTAEYAGEYGKDLFAVPYSVGVASGEGCNELIKKGALLVDSPQDVLDFYGIKDDQGQVELTEQEKEIVKALSQGQMHIEKLSSVLSKRTFIITPILSGLEIKGVVVKSGNIYGLTRSFSEE